MRGGLGDDNGVASPERLLGSERAHLRPPVFGATLFRSVLGASASCRGGRICVLGGGIGDRPVLAKSCCTLGGMKSC
jgi:hypothetical protein